jgi:hypothetical protein
MVGSGFDNEYNSTPIYYSSYNASPVNVDSGVYTNVILKSINNSGNIVGYGTYNGVLVPLYWNSYIESPIIINSGTFTPYGLSGINNNGNMIGI